MARPSPQAVKDFRASEALLAKERAAATDNGGVKSAVPTISPSLSPSQSASPSSARTSSLDSLASLSSRSPATSQFVDPTTGRPRRNLGRSASQTGNKDRLAAEARTKRQAMRAKEEKTGLGKTLSVKQSQGGTKKVAVKPLAAVATAVPSKRRTTPTKAKVALPLRKAVAAKPASPRPQRDLLAASRPPALRLKLPASPDLRAAGAVFRSSARRPTTLSDKAELSAQQGGSWSAASVDLDPRASRPVARKAVVKVDSPSSAKDKPNFNLKKAPATILSANATAAAPPTSSTPVLRRAKLVPGTALNHSKLGTPAPSFKPVEAIKTKVPSVKQSVKATKDAVLATGGKKVEVPVKVEKKAKVTSSAVQPIVSPAPLAVPTVALPFIHHPSLSPKTTVPALGAGTPLSVHSRGVSPFALFDVERRFPLPHPEQPIVERLASLAAENVWREVNEIVPFHVNKPHLSLAERRRMELANRRLGVRLLRDMTSKQDELRGLNAIHALNDRIAEVERLIAEAPILLARGLNFVVEARLERLGYRTLDLSTTGPGRAAAPAHNPSSLAEYLDPEGMVLLPVDASFKRFFSVTQQQYLSYRPGSAIRGGVKTLERVEKAKKKALVALMEALSRVVAASSKMATV
ncbi:hypothetical protein JCM6882_003503 [Rhodosporidiobolus microsporus]